MDKAHNSPIDSHLYWNDTGLVLQAGGEYHFAVPPHEQWTDLTIGCNADGYSRWHLDWLSFWKRAPHAKWFALIGAIDRDPATQFLIGTNCTLRVSRTGQLTCFANDWPSMYWNNRGSVTLTVTRLA